MSAREVIKSLYSYLPFKKEVFSVAKSLFNLPPNIYQHLHFFGVFNVRIDRKRSFKLMHIGAKVENEIFWKGLYGAWEKESLKVWAYLSKKSKYIFDIGANTGVYSLLSKAVNNSSKVYAFEPVERVYQRLNNNIVLNEYDIVPNNIALSNFDGNATIHDPGTDHVYSVTVNKKLLPERVVTQEVAIKVAKFSTWFKMNEVKGLDLMKIDVEMHEPEVIEGMKELISIHKPTILIEVLTNEVADRLQNLLQGIDYVCYGIDELKGLQKKNSISVGPSYNLMLCTKPVENLLIEQGLISI